MRIVINRNNNYIKYGLQECRSFYLFIEYFITVCCVHSIQGLISWCFKTLQIGTKSKYFICIPHLRPYLISNLITSPTFSHLQSFLSQTFPYLQPYHISNLLLSPTFSHLQPSLLSNLLIFWSILPLFFLARSIPSNIPFSFLDLHYSLSN